jgi:hypothetical protein
MAQLLDRITAQHWAKAAYDFTLAQMWVGAENQADNPLNTSGPPGGSSYANICLVAMRGIRKAAVNAGAAPTQLDRALLKGLSGLQTGCGNCGEMAGLAFAFLYMNKVFPAEIMVCGDRDHAFCVLNRRGDTDPADPDQWNDESVCIDPWQKILSRGRDMASHRRQVSRPGANKKYFFSVDVRAEAFDPAVFDKAARTNAGLGLKPFRL